MSEDVAALADLADDADDAARHRIGEPYQWGLVGISNRLAATLARMGQASGQASAAIPYDGPEDFGADLCAIHRSLAVPGSACLAKERLRHLRRAADIFGFHLATLDLRQNSDVDARIVGELFAKAGVTCGYDDLDEAARIELLAAELGTPGSSSRRS